MTPCNDPDMANWQARATMRLMRTVAGLLHMGVA